MNFISRIIKSINAMRERLKIERHEAMYGPHFNEECALKAVSKMENEDGSRDQMPTEEISTGNKYLIYYDKRTGVFQTINHIVAPAA